jgi:hypothetical protein
VSGQIIIIRTGMVLVLARTIATHLAICPPTWRGRCSHSITLCEASHRIISTYRILSSSGFMISLDFYLD